MSIPDILFLFPCTLSHKQQAAKDNVVSSTTGVPCASVIIIAWLMESAAKTTNINAPQVRLFSPDILIIMSLVAENVNLLISACRLNFVY